MLPNTERELTIYFAGSTLLEAFNSLPFDSEESASDFMNDNPGLILYSTRVKVRLADLERA